MKRFIRRACLLVLAGAGVCRAAPPDDEAIPRLLLDAKLHASIVRLVSVSADSVTVRSPEGKLSILPRESVAAILPVIEALRPEVIQLDADRDFAAPLGRLELVSGDLLPGALATQPARGDKLAWESHLWGHMELPMDRAGFVLLQPQSPYASRRPQSAADDAVLANGDTIEGFVASIGGTLRMERDHQVTELPIGRVVSVTFANPPAPTFGTWCWLHDGSAAGVASLALSPGGELKLNGVGAAAPSATLRAGELRAIVFDAARVRPLGSLPIQLGQTSPTRLWTQPPIVSDAREAAAFAPDIELPGPMTLRFTLPKGATRVGGQAELPANCRVWGDCELLVGLVGQPPTRIHLNSENPEAGFSVELAGDAGSQLEISIDPGPSGPVQDRVVLRRPMVVIGN